MNGHHDPDDVLAAVRQMEEDLERLRMRARGGAVGFAEQIAELRDESAAERAALVEDMRLVVEVVATGWRRTAAELEALRAEIGELRGLARGFAGARLELRFAEEDAPAAASAVPPRDPAPGRRTKGPARTVLPYPGRARDREVAAEADRFERPLYPVADRRGGA